jgi:hypothetical protein
VHHGPRRWRSPRLTHAPQPGTQGALMRRAVLPVPPATARLDIVGSAIDDWPRENRGRGRQWPASWALKS